jgi:hypothetical protein
MMSGHPSCFSGPLVYLWWFIFKKIQFLSLSTFLFSLLAILD